MQNTRRKKVAKGGMRVKELGLGLSDTLRLTDIVLYTISFINTLLKFSIGTELD